MDEGGAVGGDAIGCAGLAVLKLLAVDDQLLSVGRGTCFMHTVEGKSCYYQRSSLLCGKTFTKRAPDSVMLYKLQCNQSNTL